MTKILSIEIEPGDELTVYAPDGHNLDVTIEDGAIAYLSVSPEIDPDPEPEPDPDPAPGVNMVPNGMLQDAAGNRSAEGWQTENGYFLDCEKDPVNCGMHGPLLADGPRPVPFPSPTGTWYWQADRDRVKGGWARNNTWPIPPATPYDRVWTEFAAGEYDPARGLIFQYEEIGHIEEKPGSQYDGTIFVRLWGEFGGSWLPLVWAEEMRGTWKGDGPPATITLPVFTPGRYERFRIECGATLRGENAGVLWGAFVVKAA